jgi:hypothetical protein
MVELVSPAAHFQAARFQLRGRFLSNRIRWLKPQSPPCTLLGFRALSAPCRSCLWRLTFFGLALSSPGEGRSVLLKFRPKFRSATLNFSEHQISPASACSSIFLSVNPLQFAADSHSVSPSCSLNIIMTWNGGYWDPRTSSVDWCESNYTVTRYCAEFINASTNIVFFYLGLKGIAKYRDDPILLISYIGYLTVGIGSFLFHATLKCKLNHIFTT